MDTSSPRKPSTPAENARIAHALWSWGYTHGPGTVYVVMSDVPPLHRVIGVFKTQEEAEALLQKKNVSAYPPTAEQWQHMHVYVAQSSGPQTMRVMSYDVCWHDCYTEYWCPQSGEFALTANFDHWVLQAVDPRGKPLHEVEIGPDADIITISDSASKQLLFEDLRTHLGNGYMTALANRRKNSKLDNLKSSPADAK